MDKITLRNKILKERNNLSLEIKKNNDSLIFNKLVSSDIYIDSKSIFIYVSYGSEVDTKVIIKHALNTGKEIYVPKTDKTNKTMVAVRINSLDNLIVDNYGILEPMIVDNSNIGTDFDLIIMPGVAFDKKGNRIGYGGGYYDKYIYNNSQYINRVALAYDLQIVKNITCEEHDIRVNYIITEKEFIKI